MTIVMLIVDDVNHLGRGESSSFSEDRDVLAYFPLIFAQGVNIARMQAA
jgi:hypothetical protein